jgi:hypothetical protein
VRLPVKARDLPARIATGGYILHSGLEKWRGDETRAKALHGVASNAFPVLQQIPPERFLRILAASEIAIGTALLVPVVPNAVAGAALTGFSGSLLAMYARTPAMRKPGSIWPSHTASPSARTSGCWGSAWAWSPTGSPARASSDQRRATGLVPASRAAPRLIHHGIRRRTTGVAVRRVARNAAEPV